MTKDRYKDEFAQAVAMAFRNAYPEVYEATGDAEVFDPGVIYDGLQKPKDPTMGRFAFPVFRYAKLLKDKPPAIAEKVSTEAEKVLSNNGGATMHCEGVAGFLNAKVDQRALAGETLRLVIEKSGRTAPETVGQGKLNLVEYSSPNIAKPFGMGHLRSTVLGNSLRRIYKRLGYDVVGINYPGDWGTQFGKMIVAFRKWGKPELLDENAVANLLALYVRFHKEADDNPSLNDEARLAFKQLEEGEPEATKLWESFKQISNSEFERIYNLLGVEFDWVYGESHLNDQMEPLVKRLKNAGLTSVSRGALVVDLDDPQLPPVLLKKADGATLYATRDLAGMVYRKEKYPNFNESLYVVNVAQSDYFKQCRLVIDRLEAVEGVPKDERTTPRIKHVDFGWVRFAGRSMSTRRGNIVLLEEVINEAARMVRARMSVKNPDLENADDISQMVGVGAVIFSQLSVRRQRDVDFQWEEVLNFEGETGPYLQYTHARLCSL
ncbi:arginine--tRNA ligase, partial [candidate division GN15 bacterium]|nr:arginine--tRNA ligase [candidate division GN15 bacterium]